MGAVAVEAETLAELEEAFRGARGSGRTTVIVVRTDPNAWTGGDAWWDVGVPEVSEREEVVVARAQHEAERKHQRTGV
jgi:3D-(3,5/4)-trihydroxycyclohexane-1,2-dione acylhydrolase (decyclizing)